MSSATITLTKPEDAFQLPQGSLILGCFEVGLCRENVYDCAAILLENSDVDGLTTQAEVIERAGNKYEWGNGGGYTATGGSAESDADLPAEKSTIVNLATARDALRLVEGRLSVPGIEVNFGETDVLEAAELLIENGDGDKLVSQAGVIARAGNKYGWGMGEGYSTL